MKGWDEVKRRECGFTLIELAIVMVLICILGVALIPSMKMVYKQEIRKAADSLCGDLVIMHKQAIVTSEPYTLTITNRYQYSISPKLIQGAGDGKLNNDKDDISPNITYTIVKASSKNEDGTDYGSETEICYQGGKLIDPTATTKQADYLIIKVEYDGTNEYAEIRYDGLSGRYSVTFMP